MPNCSDASLIKHFASLTDPQVNRRKRHNLIDIVVIAIFAVISGADSWCEVELYGQSKLKWLKTFLALPNGIPSHDTFGRVFARIDPVEFQACFQAWTQAVMSMFARKCTTHIRPRCTTLNRAVMANRVDSE